MQRGFSHFFFVKDNHPQTEERKASLDGGELKSQMEKKIEEHTVLVQTRLPWLNSTLGIKRYTH